MDDAALRRLRAGTREDADARLLPRDPSVDLPRELRAACCARASLGARAPRRGEAVRHGPRVGARAEPAPHRDHPRGAPLPNRPLPRQGAGPGHHVPAVRERALRAGLEPRARRVDPDHDGRRLRRRGSWGTSTTRSARYGTSCRTTSCRSSRSWGWSLLPETTTRSRVVGSTCSARCPRSTRRTPCAVSTSGLPGQIEGVRPDSDTETFVGLRLEIENWRWSGVPIFVRAGKGMPVNATEIVVRLQRVPEAALGHAPSRLPRLRRHRLPDRTGCGDVDRALRQDSRQGGLASPSRSTSRLR